MFVKSSEILDFTVKIGVTRFELATSRPPAERATKLRHTPIVDIITKAMKNSKNKFKIIVTIQSAFAKSPLRGPPFAHVGLSPYRFIKFASGEQAP